MFHAIKQQQAQSMSGADDMAKHDFSREKCVRLMKRSHVLKKFQSIVSVITLFRCQTLSR